MNQWIARILPFTLWFKDYQRHHFRADLVAGLTVALVLIPQSMAYAQLAGLPAYYGLYAAFLPPLVAALFGSSRQLATGPVAVVSLMTAASLEPLATAGSASFIAYAVALAMIVGVFQLALGLLRLGLVVNFLSHPVVNGFTNAAAIIIATSQLSKIFGVTVDKANLHYETILKVIEQAWHYTHWPTVFMALLAFAVMFALKKISPRIPNVLVAVVITTTLSWAIGFDNRAQVPVSAIDSVEAQALFQRYDEVRGYAADVAEQRTRVNTELETLKRNNGENRKLTDKRYELTLLNAELQYHQDDLRGYRKQLRNLLFHRIGEGDNARFVPSTEGDRQRLDDRDVWRLNVSNKTSFQDSVSLQAGGAVVGRIPEGLPKMAMPSFGVNDFLTLLPYAAIISLLGFMEAISIAKAMAAKTGQRLDPNQELIGQGLANIIGSVGQSYPTSGSFSRSAVNIQAGAVTGMSSVITSLSVVVALLLLTPLLYHLPQSVLAAVIMMAVVGLVNVSGFIHSWKAQRYDGIISIITFVATLAFAPHLDKGIMIGVVLSLVVFLYRSMHPAIASLSMAKDEALHDSVIYGLKECEYLAILRFNGPLFFANASFLENRINYIRSTKPKLRHLLMVANGINEVDASGVDVLESMVDRLRSAGIDVSFSGVNNDVLDVMKRSHLLDKIGQDHLYPITRRAALHIHKQVHDSPEDELDCPLTIVASGKQQKEATDTKCA
jgi:MFS superfamily sulfate permease-like transporter